MDVSGAVNAVEALHEAMSPDEQKVFAAELVARFNLVSEASGVVAVADVVDKPEETELEKQLPNFLNPNVKLSGADQLGIMRGFYAEMGMTMPELTTEQTEKLNKALEANPHLRVMPAPLLDLAGRQRLAEVAKVSFGKNDFDPNRTALWTPDTSWLYGELLQNPEATVKNGGKSYGLLYKTGQGEPVKREAYIAGLKNQGQAVEATDGNTWTFSVMDVRVRAPRQYSYVRDLHAKVNPTSTPEAHLAMQLVHQANGTANDVWEADIVNEAVYELDRKGAPKAPVYVSGVNWNPGNRQVDLRDWDAGDRPDDLGVRAEESGL